MNGGGGCDEEEPSHDIGVVRSGVLRVLTNVVEKHSFVFKILRMTSKKL
jgi:hypothetical protein